MLKNPNLLCPFSAEKIEKFSLNLPMAMYFPFLIKQVDQNKQAGTH